MGPERFTAKLVNTSDEGFGLETSRHLAVGCRVRLKGQVAEGLTVRMIEVDGLVRWSAPGPNGKYLCGVLVDKEAAGLTVNFTDPDYYEVLQLSPNADPDTIHRVYRVLAQRLHPDNPQTGDESSFKALTQAYEMLSDPVTRAGYDAKRPQLQQRWRIFDSSTACQGFEGERRKRHGILSLLYVRRMNDPREPTMSLLEFERLLGVPREHLEFALWFLKESGWVLRTDNSRFSISPVGVEKVEAMGELPVARERMIPAAAGALS